MAKAPSGWLYRRLLTCSRLRWLLISSMFIFLPLSLTQTEGTETLASHTLRGAETTRVTPTETAPRPRSAAAHPCPVPMPTQDRQLPQMHQAVPGSGSRGLHSQLVP